MRAFAKVDKRPFVGEGKIAARFLTLTYPGAWEHYTPGDVKRHLDNFLKALRRKYPKSAGFWRLEFQARGAPHFHILVLNVPWVEAKWLGETWFRIVGSGDPRHLKAGTEVREVKSWQHATWYIAKYMSKAEGATPPSDVAAPWSWPGRFWGGFNRAMLTNEAVDAMLDDPRFHRLKRVVFKWMRSRGYHLMLHRHQGIQAFLDWASARRLMEWLE